VRTHAQKYYQRLARLSTGGRMDEQCSSASTEVVGSEHNSDATPEAVGREAGAAAGAAAAAGAGDGPAAAVSVASTGC
jgi:hypothetical protein